MAIEYSKEIQLGVDETGTVRQIIVDGVDISGWIAGTSVSIVSGYGAETTVEVKLTAPKITYVPIDA